RRSRRNRPGQARRSRSGPHRSRYSDRADGLAPRQARPMTGTFVAVVGPSGAGKDSVINFARDKLGDEVVVVRRVVTRTADGGSEDHDSLSAEAFAAAERGGQFALSWEAHGLNYGLPITLEED